MDLLKDIFGFCNSLSKLRIIAQLEYKQIVGLLQGISGIGSLPEQEDMA